MAVAMIAAGAVAVSAGQSMANTTTPGAGDERPGISIELGERDFRG
jgi:hypothetical protein